MSKSKVIWIIAFVLVVTLVVGYFLIARRQKNAPQAAVQVQTKNGEVLCANFTDLAEAQKNPDAVCSLNLFNKNLTEFPAGISKFKHLQYLNLAANKIQTIPAEIGDLPELKNLWLGDNQLTTLPPEIGNLTNLSLLSLFQNKITSIPPEISNLKSLSILGLKGNPVPTKDISGLKRSLPKSTVVF